MPRLLDLFCGAGGCSVGYHTAGFEVVGVDSAPQPRYPFAFHQADALEFLAAHGREFDAIHASPPCQRYSHAAFSPRHKERHPDLVGATREHLDISGRPWVIENVYGAPLTRGSVMLCGLMFGLKVFRHRWFESSHLLFVPGHPPHAGRVIGKDGMCCVVGHGGGVSRRMREQIGRHGRGGQQGKAEWQTAMGIDWMNRDELSQAIPPAYTEWIGRQLVGRLAGSA
jgi:DNA (cytosine-5)-methyltransferase 1